MNILETMVANDPGGRVTVTFLGQDGEAVEVHMPGSADEMPSQQLVERAKVMLLEAAAAGDGRQPSRGGNDHLTVAPMPSEMRDPFISAPEDVDDNAYEMPDEALPDDREEDALDKSMSREATRFDRIK
jgi:hypothetical protein